MTRLVINNLTGALFKVNDSRSHWLGKFVPNIAWGDHETDLHEIEQSIVTKNEIQQLQFSTGNIFQLELTQNRTPQKLGVVPTGKVKYKHLFQLR